jgi:hypothetical protein
VITEVVQPVMSSQPPATKQQVRGPAAQVSVAKSLGCPSSHHEMQNEGYHREYEQQVDQATGDVKDTEAANPRYQQHNE